MPKKACLIGPAVETLFAMSKGSYWPKEILSNPVIQLQTKLRQTLHAKLDSLFSRIKDPATEVAEALEAGVVEADAVAEVYDLLAEFLDADWHHRRLVLYLPFELLPPKRWTKKLETLQASSDRFVRSYMRRWNELLDETDVRANFVDGNILEPELAPNGQPMVRKAAHLIPQLLRKGLLSDDEVTARMNGADDILKASIADALPASSVSSGGTVQVATEVERKFDYDWLTGLPDEIEYEVRKLDMRAALDQSRDMPPARVAWERKNNEDVLASLYATRIAASLAAVRIAPQDLLPLLTADLSALRFAAMRAIGLAVETIAETDVQRAKRIASYFIKRIEERSLNTVELRDELEGTLARWAGLRLVPGATLKRFGFELPALDAPFSNTSSLSKDLRSFGGAIDEIVRTPEYSRLLYPVAMFFGSRLKHYAKRNADLDAAVFVRPGVAQSERPKIRAILSRLFAAKKIDGKVVEFWLEADGKGLRVRDFPDADVFLGDSSWIHLLLASVWLGTDETLRELYTKLLPGFFYSKGKAFLGQDIRSLWLEEMEREVLQYRLMHKGYRRFFAPSGAVRTDATGLDPQSVFWDSGYRRLATKLFVDRVFLPQLG
jgi:hypothetical protein